VQTNDCIIVQLSDPIKCIKCNSAVPGEEWCTDTAKVKEHAQSNAATCDNPPDGITVTKGVGCRKILQVIERIANRSEQEYV
jgi:hypothetical protein